LLRAFAGLSSIVRSRLSAPLDSISRRIAENVLDAALL